MFVEIMTHSAPTFPPLQLRCAVTLFGLQDKFLKVTTLLQLLARRANFGSQPEKNLDCRCHFLYIANNFVNDFCHRNWIDFDGNDKIGKRD